MDPFKVFSTIINRFVSRPLRMISFDFTNPDYKITILTIISTIYSMSFPIFSVTTCYETDLTQCTQSLVMGFVGSQCSVKAFFATINHFGLRSNIKLIKNVYEANTKDGLNKEDLRKAVGINYIVAKIFAVVIMSTGLGIIFAPAGVYVFTGLVIPIMAVKIIFVPMDTVFGYIFHVIFHLFGLYNAVLGLIGFDIFMMTTTIHIWPMTRILERAISNLNRATRSINHDAVRDSVWLKIQMRNIVLMHRENYFYVRDILKMSYPLTTAELYTNQTALILLVYCIITLKWVPGMLLFVCLALKLLSFCMIGTAVDYLNDKTYDALINIDCTMLPKAEQRNVMFILHASQHPPMMRAGLVPINLTTFVEVVKTIYTLAMLLLESV